MSLIKQILRDNFSLSASVGNIIWALIFVILASIWARFKASPQSTKRQAGMWITGVIGVFLLLTLINNIANRYHKMEGFKGSLILGTRITMPPGMTNLNVNSGIITNDIDATMQGIPQERRPMQDGIDMMFILRLVNSDTPSVAWNWKANVTLPGGTKIAGFIPSVSSLGPNGATFQTIIGPYTAKLTNNLMQQLEFKPLDSGASAIGWVFVHINGLRDPPDGAQFDISFEDAHGNQTVITDVWNQASMGH